MDGEIQLEIRNLKEANKKLEEQIKKLETRNNSLDKYDFYQMETKISSLDKRLIETVDFLKQATDKKILKARDYLFAKNNESIKGLIKVMLDYEGDNLKRFDEAITRNAAAISVLMTVIEDNKLIKNFSAESFNKLVDVAAEKYLNGKENFVEKPPTIYTIHTEDDKIIFSKKIV